ncbi:DNA ligase 6 isoform X2 [Tripterygium wilfordii]|uniref:DNA ligase 6 isoform X2 n=1 Tax=Tripterygium wilfordii TaxID=458696 RepID=UPI0018F82320|nr:DNA ligase 6 isoform X2 [Tripterygium wilfordii]
MASQTIDSTKLYLSSLDTPTESPLSLPPIPSFLPPSKLIPGTRFLVDAFRHAGDFSVSFFLSHFHSDHYVGLSSNWSKGLIFCSPTTARLLVEVLQLSSQFVVSLPLKETVIIDGCEVVIVDANHCPGAVQFLFKIPTADGKFERYVHTGDFRFCEGMKLEPLIREFVGCNAIFLDTTYCNKKHVFPLQEESVEYVVSVIERIGGEYKSDRKDVLFLIATYVIGKEKILLEVARKCKRKVHVDHRKMKVLGVLGYGESGVFTEDEGESDVHVVGWNVLGETWPYFRPNFVKMKEIMFERGYSKVVGFVPTGWTYEVKRNKFTVRSKDSFEIHLVPYSEHSNYDELREYVKFLKPKRVVPTVGMDVEKLDSKHVDKMKKHFAGLVDEMANKKEFLMGFYRGSCENDEIDEVEVGPSMGMLLDEEEVLKLSGTKPVKNNDLGIILNSLSPMQEPVSHELTVLAEKETEKMVHSQGVTLLNDEETEKTLQELCDCLPTWVTRDQMLDLIGKSGSNIVDAVSFFYEHETQFHEQAFTCMSSGSALHTSLPNDTALCLEPVLDKSNHGNMDIPSSQNYQLPNVKLMTKSSISPGKRKRTTDKSPSTKTKTNSKLGSDMSKQSTITRFFSKISLDVSQDGQIGSLSEQCPEDKLQLPSDPTFTYKEQIDQFIQIINCNELSQSYAATIMEKTKGDVNMALDIYYGKTQGTFGDDIDELVGRSKAVEIQCCSNNPSPDQEKYLSKKLRRVDDSSALGYSTDTIDKTLLSLPPDKYNPVEHACWKLGQPAPYIHLARTFDLVEGEKGKIKATSMLCNMFRSLLVLSPEDVLPAVYLCTNKIAADHENMELNIGGALVTSALEEACGTKRSKIRDMYNTLGDLGDVAQMCRQTQSVLAPPPPLLIKDVFSVLRKISEQTGNGSTGRKKNLIVNLIRSCKEKETKFLVRTLVKNLRIGAMVRTVLPALAQAVVLNACPHSHLEIDYLKEKLQCISAAAVDAYTVLPNLDLVVLSLINKGTEFSSSTLSMVAGIPIKPMLAKITNGVPQALKLFQNKAFTCEYKYDGQRAQIHKLADGTFHVFSRNGEETTSRFPDLIDIVKQSCKPAAVTFILDAEVVGVDRKSGFRLLSFQELSSRKRGSKDSLITVDNIKAVGFTSPSKTQVLEGFVI